MSVRVKSLRAALIASAFAAAAVPALPAAAQSSTVKVELGGSGPASRQLSLPRGKSAIVDLPVDARDVLVSNPSVADAVLRTPRRIYVLGTSPGQTDAVFFDAAGRQILSLDIRVDQPTGAFEETLKRVAPDADVKIEPVNDSLILTGTVGSAAESDRVQRLAERFVGKPEQVVNMLSIRGAEQVMLKVRVVEMQRNVIKQLGFNTQAVLDGLNLATTQGFSVNTKLLGGLTGTYTTPGSNFAKFNLQAFERVGLVRTLAEPNLTAVSGEAAKFLAGGEFPVPTGLDQNGNVTVQFKPFGVGLSFTPVVMSQGRISLKISTEVSELTTDGSLKFNTNLTIPALSVRRADTTVEMPSGGALMIAGLLQEKTRQNIDSLPGATNLPVLGTLFRSRDYLAGETEMVVIVEPYLVKPTSADKLQTPVDGLLIASDPETVLMGRLNRAYHGDKAAPPPASWHGPVGYVVE